MNTKGMKFLAVLAVLAMAFAAFAVIAPAETDDATSTDVTGATYADDDGYVITAEAVNGIETYSSGAIAQGTVYYVASDATLNVPLTSETETLKPILLLIEEGHTVTLSVPAGTTQAPITGAVWISALSVVKSTSGDDTLYTSPTALGTGWINSTKLTVQDAYEEWDGQPAVSGVALGFSPSAAGESYAFVTDEESVWWTSVNADGEINVSGTAVTLRGSNPGTVVSTTTSAQTVNFYGYTGTYKTYGKVEVLKFTDFTGSLVTSESGAVATIDGWEAGNVTVVTSPTDSRVINNVAIPTGCTLTVNASQFLTQSYATGTFAGTIVNKGTMTLPGNVYGNIENSGTLAIAEVHTIYGTLISTSDVTIESTTPVITVAQGGLLSAPMIYKNAVTGTAMIILKEATDGLHNGGTFNGTITYLASGDSNIDSKASLDVKAAYKDGSTDLSITIASVTISGPIDGVYSESQITGITGTVALSGLTVTGGQFTVNGDVATSGDVSLVDTTFIVGEAATLTLGNETSITSESESIILIGGSVALASAAGTGTIGTSDVVVKMGSTGTLYPTLASTLAAAGVLITDSNMETQYVYDTALGTHDYPANQILVVDGSWTLADGAIINVSGKLIVPEGSTLTINDGAVLNIIDAASLEVYGKLIVDEPETDTTDGGDLNITNGSMTVYGELTNGGKITVAQDMAVTIAEGGFAKIEDTGVLTTTTGTLFTVESGAALTVVGCIDGASVLNYGIVTINSSYAAQSASYIYQMANGAITYVQLYTINSDYYDTASLTISDAGYHLYTYRNTTTHLPAYVIMDDYNEIVITGALNTTGGSAVDSADYNIEVSDLTIISSSVLKKSTADKTVSTNYYKYMDVAGDIEATYLYVGNDAGISTHVASATVTAAAGTSNASMTITDDLLVRDYTAFYLSGGSMKVTGNVSTFSTAGSFGMDSDAKMTVADDGLIEIYGQAFTDKTGLNATEIIIPTMVGSRTVKVYTYMTVDNALEYLAGDLDVVGQANVYGTQTVTETATLYADDVLIVTGTLNVGASNGSSVVLTIEDGATVKGAGYVYVNGTMYAEDKTDVKISDANISADVKTVELDDKGKAVKNGWAKWTNVLTAIAETDDGTVVITRDATSATLPAYVYITSNLEIPEGVVLSVPSGAAPLVLYDGVTLTVNGTLVVGATSEVYAQTAFNLIAYKVDSKAFSSAVVVNGSLVTSYEVEYAAGTNATSSNKITNTAGFDALISSGAGGAPIAGAYYQLDGYYVISSLDVAMYSIYDIDTDIVIYGNVTAGDVVFTATEYVDNITLSATNVDFFLLDGDNPTTIYNSLKVDSIALYCPSDLTSVALTIAELAGNTFTGTVISSGSQVTVAGAEDVVFTVKPAGTIALTTETAIMVDDSGDAFSIDSGTVILSAVTITNTNKTYMVIAEGATAKAEGSTTSIDYLIVNGTLSVPTATSLRIDNQIIVNGTMDVASTTASAAKGTFTVADEAMVFIGITADDYTAASNATVSGPVTFTVDAYVMVYSGASVTDEFLGCLGTTSTTFFVEGAAWFTAYKVGAPTTTYLTFDEVPVSNAVLDGWASTNGGSRIYFEYDEDEYSYYNLIVGAYSELYAVLDYEIYSVIIMADQGVKNVSIDGVLLLSDATGTDQFVTVAGIAAGTHKVTFALYSGHEGTAILQYVDATSGITATVLGMNFTVSGDNAGIVTLQLVGIEESDEPTPVEKSEWTITTILLVILVILIAIMAVIVALRLNRS